MNKVTNLFNNNDPQASGKMTLVMMIIVVVILLGASIVLVGVSLWLGIILIVWILFFVLMNRNRQAGIFSIGKSVLIFVVLFIITIILLGVSSSTDENEGLTIRENTKTDGQNVVADGGTYSGKLSATNQFAPTEGQNTKSINYTISAIAELYPPTDMKKVRIVNVHIEKMPTGEVTLLLPTGGYSESFTNDGSNVIGLMAVSDGEQYSANKISKTFAPLSLQIRATNAYTFDSNEALNVSPSGIGPSRSFQYAGVDPAQLDNRLSFDVEIELVSGETITKRFTGDISGAEFVKTGGVEATAFRIE